MRGPGHIVAARAPLAAAVLLLIFTAAASASSFPELPSSAPSSTYRVPASFGVEGEVRIYREALGREITVVIARLSKSGLVFKARDRRASGEKKGIYTDAASRADLLVISGGFFGYDTNGHLIPLGLLVDSGRRASRQVKWSSGGMLFEDSAGIRIVRAADYKPETAPADAVQSKPMVVMGGLNDMPVDDTHLSDRVAIGLTNTGDVLVAGVFGDDEDSNGATLHEMGDLMVAAGAVSALAMDGGPSSHIYIPWLRMHLGYTGLYYVPNTLHFRAAK